MTDRTDASGKLTRAATGRVRSGVRGQSELLGFLLIFALVIAAMGLVTVGGLGELRDLRDEERVRNAERAFDVLADNVDDLATERATSRATEIALADAAVRYGDPVTVTVNGTATADPTANFSYAFDLRPVVYESDGAALVFAGGATFHQSRDSAAMLSEPSLVLSPARSNVLVVQTRAVGDLTGVAGSSTALVRTERAETDIYRVNASQYDLSVRVDSPRAGAWRRYFADRSGVTCRTIDADSVECSLTTDRLYVTVVRVDVLLE
jgi:hypothetical protein